MSQRTIVRGSLGFLDARNPDEDLKFQYNPTTMSRNRRAEYAHNMAALADFPNAGPSAIPSIEWNRNQPEEFTVELFFNRQGNEQKGHGAQSVAVNVEAELKKLDDLMKPDQNTGRPRDLILKMGPRSDRVRITDKSVVEKMFDPDLNVQQATVTLRLTALKSRSR
jgi:hypothetical protein